MLQLNRRDVFRGLTALAASSLVSCKNTGDGSRAPANTLNVIFHGPFIFRSFADRVEVIAADVSGHVYGLGSWKEEYFMAKSYDYYLDNLVKQNPVTANEDMKVKFPKTTIIQDTSRYCKIVLTPVPAKIVPLGLFRIPDGFDLFRGKDAEGANKVRTLGSSHACVYYSVSKPSVRNSGWVPVPNSLGATNLHFIATPFVQMGPDHPVESFRNLKKMMPSLDLDLDLETVKKNFEFIEPACSPLEGVFREEQASLRAPLNPKPEPCGAVRLHPPLICDAPSLFVAG